MECVRRFLKAADVLAVEGKSVNTNDIDEYLRFVARTGKTHVPWKKLKFALISRVSKVIDDFFDEQCNDKQSECPAAEASKCLQTKDRIVQCLLEFDGIPFTIQRIAELITDPRKNYKRVDKFLRAVEKNVMVITTIDPMGNRIVTDLQQSSANSWNENLFPPPSPSSRVRRMSVDELVDTSSCNVASPQMVAAAMMPPPPSPPPFSPKQQKSPLPVEPLVDITPSAPELPVNASSDAVDDIDGNIESSVQNKMSKKPVIVWHGDNVKRPTKYALAKSPTLDAQLNTDVNSKSPEPQAAEVSTDEHCLSHSQNSEPLTKRQRFSDDDCDCDSTTPDGESASSPVSVSTPT